jgi:hypothetical protein
MVKCISKKSQAAMEFLMTYGWAIFISLTVFGALFFFGVVDLKSKMPETIMFPPPIKGEEFTMTSEGIIRIKLVNHLDETIVINNTWAQGTDECENIDTFSVDKINVNPQEAFVLEYTCPDAIGKRVKVYLSFKYARASTGIEKTHSGYVLVNGQ